MNEISKSPPSPLTLQDVHRAIETLAISQAQIGLGVLRLLHEKLPHDEYAQTLFDGIDQAVRELQDLAQSFLDKPFDG